MSYPLGGVFKGNVTGTSSSSSKPVENPQSSARAFSNKISHDCMPIFVEKKEHPEMCSPNFSFKDVAWAMWNNK